MKCSRRSTLAWSAAALVGTLTSTGSALDRPHYGGQLRIALPIRCESVDPHDRFDLAAALLGSALFEPLFALDARGRPYPTLASELPEAQGKQVRVRLRPGLLSSSGKRLTSRDVAWSLTRARSKAAGFLLRELSFESHRTKDGEELIIRGGSPAEIARALSHPFTACVPDGFSPRRPVGTGALQVARLGSSATLQRNQHCARGGAYLDSWQLTTTSSVAEGLRAFESGATEIGFLGAGLHRPRPGARSFDAGPLGLLVVRTGARLGPWGARGVAQQVIDSANLRPLEQLGVKTAGRGGSSEVWRGPAVDLDVPRDHPLLMELGRALLGALGGEEAGLRLQPRSPQELQSRFQSGDYDLQLVFVRLTDNSPEDRRDALLVADGQKRGAPRETAEALARRLTSGILGELHFRGAHVPELRGVGALRTTPGDLWLAQPLDPRSRR